MGGFAHLLAHEKRANIPFLFLSIFSLPSAEEGTMKVPAELVDDPSESYTGL